MKELDAVHQGPEGRDRACQAEEPGPREGAGPPPEGAERKLRKEREDSLSKISDAIDKAILDEHADAKTVREVAAKVLKDHNLDPAGPGAFDAKTATVNDVLAIAKGLFEAGKVAEMRRLHETLGQMLKVIDTAMKTAAAA